MILIFAPKITNRVGYTFNLIFDRILNCNFKLTDDRELFANHPGAKICYNGDRLCDDCIFIKSSPLLFQYNIENVEPECFEFDDGTFSEFTHSNRLKAIFPVHDSESDLEFDIFAASFYLTSRYEEYPVSSHGTGECFEYKKSIACRNGFLEYPVINMWCEILKSLISGKFPEFEWHRKKFEHIATINISTPFKYKEIGHVRTIAGMLRDIREHESLLPRLRTIFGKQTDPYDNYDEILSISRKYNCKTLFFSATGNISDYDKPIAYTRSRFRLLLRHLTDYGKVGNLFSYDSHDSPDTLSMETERLSGILHKPIVRSRFSHLHYRLPVAYQNLVNFSIEDDFSMGYEDCPGFRAGICTPFHFFDLEKNTETDLEIHPVAYSSRFGTGNPENRMKIINYMIDIIFRTGGTFYSSWDIENFANDGTGNPGLETYREILKHITEFHNK